MKNVPMSTPNKVSFVAQTMTHKPYTRHRHTLAGTPSITHRDLANDVTIDEPIFGVDPDGDTD